MIKQINTIIFSVSIKYIPCDLLFDIKNYT